MVSMSEEYYFDPKTGTFRYKTEKDYPNFSTFICDNSTGLDKDAGRYFKQLYNGKELPSSPLLNNYATTERGYFDLGNIPYEILTEDPKDSHEKARPPRIGIADADGKIVPHYYKSYDMAGSIQNGTGKIFANAIGGRLFPTKMPYYIAQLHGYFGTIGIDLNHLNGLKALRLDQYLFSKGIGINSIVTLIRAYRSGVLQQDLTENAIAQLMVGMFSLSNAIGEQDSNSRNVILLGPDEKGAKFDTIVRIDFDKNILNEEFGKNETPNVGFGMFGYDEGRAEFQENLIKALTDNQITVEDANLILALHEVTRYATKQSNFKRAVDEATTTQVEKEGKKSICVINKGCFSYEKVSSYADNMADNAKNYLDFVKDSFAKVGDKTHKTFKTDIDQLPSLDR